MLICEGEDTVAIRATWERICDMLVHGLRPEDVTDDTT